MTELACIAPGQVVRDAFELLIHDPATCAPCRAAGAQFGDFRCEETSDDAELEREEPPPPAPRRRSRAYRATLRRMASISKREAARPPLGPPQIAGRLVAMIDAGVLVWADPHYVRSG